jgi:glucose-6-phosphate 1-epimerase
MKPNADDLVELRSTDGAGATVHLQGAHVLSWYPACGAQQLYLSKSAIFEPGVPIRGGVPVVFPQFSGLGKLAKHGFARTERWHLIENKEGCAKLRLVQNEETLKQWGHPFQLDLELELGGQQLDMWLQVTNTGSTSFEFMAALHSYLSMADVTAGKVAGLSGLEFTDSVTGKDHFDDQPEVEFGTDIDRLYHRAEARSVRVGLHEINQEGFADTVVWNPGPVTGGKIADLEQPEGWRKFVCVESAQVKAPVTLAPGRSWRGGQQLIARTR